MLIRRTHMSAHQIAARHFGARVITVLAQRGIRILGTTVIPSAGAMPFANGSTGYNIDDNGTGRILSYSEVKALA